MRWDLPEWAPVVWARLACVGLVVEWSYCALTSFVSPSQLHLSALFSSSQVHAIKTCHMPHATCHLAQPLNLCLSLVGARVLLKCRCVHACKLTKVWCAESVCGVCGYVHGQRSIAEAVSHGLQGSRLISSCRCARQSSHLLYLCVQGSRLICFICFLCVCVLFASFSP